MATVPSSCNSHCESVGCFLGHFAQVALGIMLLVLGAVLILTLWLMPIGLISALLGGAMIGAGSSRL